MALSATEATYWIEQASSNVRRVEEAAVTSTRSLWQSFTGWYAGAAVAGAALAQAEVSEAAQEAAVGILSEYVAEVFQAMTGARTNVPRFGVPGARAGAGSLVDIYGRVAEVYRNTFAKTADPTVSLERALLRATDLMTADIMLAGRLAQSETMKRLGVTQYRRLIRPELSATGTCGLCIAAADRIYKTGDLLPMHERCKCLTIPVIDGQDPGRGLNAEDIRKAYAEAAALAGGTGKSKLSNVRFAVNDHGELGPVLTREGDNFRGPNDTGLNRERAVRELAQILPILALLQKRQTAGENVSDALAYQQERIALLRRVAA